MSNTKRPVDRNTNALADSRYSIVSIEHLFLWPRIWRSAFTRKSIICIYHNEREITIETIEDRRTEPVRAFVIETRSKQIDSFTYVQ